MIPESPARPYFDLPASARAPLRGEIDEEGLGFFQDVWIVEPSPIDEVRSLIRWESSVVEAIDGLAESSESFDALAHVIEGFVTDGDDMIEPDEYPELTTNERETLQRCLDAGTERLDGVDLGVTGLVGALASTGFVPAASCRGHIGTTAWAECPTVIFAGDHDRVARLREVVLRSSCSLDDGSGNGEGLVALRGPSVIATMSLADALLDLGLDG